MIKKDFKEGDIYIITSHRKGLTNGIYHGVAGIFTGGKYVRDVTVDEAIELHTKVMNKNFPGMKVTKEMVKEAFNDDPNERYFLNDAGEVHTYSNHEKPDIFDMRYINGEDLSKLAIEKDKWIKDHNVKPDEDGHFRCWND